MAADLRKDLTDSIVIEKYYDEIELGRLSKDPNMNYKEKIKEMNVVLNRIALQNMKLGLVESYFTPQQPVTQQSPAQNQGGQTHGE